jgi:type IV pilus assembly protein PilY1
VIARITLRRLPVLALALALVSGAAPTFAGAPQLRVPDEQLGLAGGRVPPNLLLNLSLTFVDAGAAYREQYRRSVDYDGYFNPRMCYSYPMARRSASVLLPDLDDTTGHFSIDGAADAQHECGGLNFSGNFLNWASMSTLDLLRLGLTGGDRIVDTPGLTILQRAWLPDGSYHPDFYASPTHFPRKQVSAGADGSAPSRVTPFDTEALYIVSCRNRLLFGRSAKGHDCDAPRFGAGGRRLVSDKFFGEFNVRVKVCVAVDLRGLCRPYASGAKPEGAIQQYSAGMRIGLMSYLTEYGATDANLYGGVLRAPLKHLGAERFDAPDYAASVNPQAEWQAANGVQAANPDHASGPVSGAINYINQLGRAQPARLGAYKAADPGAELFYESLRYLQGRAPSEPVGGTNDAGFPVWNTRADPINASCQRTAVATIGHSSFIDDRGLPGNARAGKKDASRAVDGFAPSAVFDVMQSTRKIGSMEADSSGTYGNRKRRPDLLALDGLDDDAGSYYLAGAALWAHTHAIRADKDLRLDSYSLELGRTAHASSGALFLAAKYGGFDDRNGDGNPFISKPRRPADSEWSIDGITPDTYFSAADGAAVAGALRAMFAGVANPRGALTGQAVVATRHGAGTFVIQSSYEQTGWSGTLERRAILPSRAGALDVATTPQWEAGQRLAEMRPAERRIFTTSSKADRTGLTAPFNWSSLSGEQRAYLDTTPGGEVRDGLGEARLDYLRGERSREIGRDTGVFRRRASVLGDSIHGVPLVVGAPSASVQGPGYDRFYERNKTRVNAVYVGANDGMLHAFNVDDGTELFAFVPSALLPTLGQLTNPAYRHRSFLDASAGYGEAIIAASWHSVLVSGMGMGARGVFALDVTNPAAFSSGAGALWEFTEKDDSAMGHVRAAPLVVKLHVGDKDKAPLYRYFALVSSGINNYGPDTARSDSGGALFLLALDKPASAPWRLGDNYYRLSAAAADSGAANALGPAALAVALDGSVRFAYAGDLQGRMWRFDLSAGPARASASVLFEARDDAGRRQPIAHAPKVVFAPGGGYVVLFASGQMLEAADLQPSGFAPQSMYAVVDTAATPPVPVRGRSQLTKRSLSGSASYAIAGSTFEYGADSTVKGWYFDFPHAREDGERAAGSPVLSGSTLFISTTLPGTDPCAGAKSRTYVLDALSGFAFKPDGVAASEAITGELAAGSTNAMPLIFDMSASVGRINATGGATATRTLGLLRFQGENVPPLITPVGVSLPAKRLSWRELANWRDLHPASKK